MLQGQAQPLDIGPYRIVDKLGEGGMGVVYVAIDTRLDRRVALKILRPDAGGPDAQRRLIREARIAAGLSHPLICQVFELGEWQAQPFIAMELIEGESLDARLRHGALAPAEALRLMRLIVEALGVLHTRGVVHRDLKPSNIFLTGTSIKVLDFGLARPFDGTTPETWGSHAGRHGGGDAAVRRTRATHRRTGRRAGGPLLGRCHPVRDADGPATVRRTDAGRGHSRGPV